MTYVPPERAKQFAIKPEDGWISHGWLLFEEWRTKKATKSYEQTAEALSLASGNITGWKKGRIPSMTHARRIQALSGVDPDAWTWWLREDGENANAPKEPVPPSERRPKSPRVRGTTQEELWLILDEIDEELADTELTGSARAGLLGRKASTLERIARSEERSKLEEHPEFDSFADLLHIALERTLSQYGVVPDGARSVFAEHLEAAEAEQRKRAA